MTRVAGVIDLIGYSFQDTFWWHPLTQPSPSFHDLWALACTCKVCVKHEFPWGGTAQHSLCLVRVLP